MRLNITSVILYISDSFILDYRFVVLKLKLGILKECLQFLVSRILVLFFYKASVLCSVYIVDYFHYKLFQNISSYNW